MVRVSFPQRLDHRFLGRAVDLGDEVVLALGGDGEPVEVARGAVDDRAGAARRLDGDMEHRMKSVHRRKERRLG